MQWRPTLRLSILRERWRASRLPSLRSALRGLDPRHALPTVSAFIGASAGAEHRQAMAISPQFSRDCCDVLVVQLTRFQAQKFVRFRESSSQRE
jgi:hypothetical protein